MKNKLRIIFMGTPEFSVPSLKEISNHCDIISVYTQPPRGSGRGLKTKLSPIHILANKMNILVKTPDNFSDVKLSYLPAKGPTGPHAIVLVGYDDNYKGGSFRALNSYGEDWGDDGFFWITYEDFASNLASSGVFMLYNEDLDFSLEKLPSGGFFLYEVIKSHIKNNSWTCVYPFRISKVISNRTI